MTDREDEYLTTTPGTQMSWEMKPQNRSCWRCRLHLRWPPWRKHWQCMMGPKLTYLEH